MKNCWNLLNGKVCHSETKTELREGVIYVCAAIGQESFDERPTAACVIIADKLSWLCSNQRGQHWSGCKVRQCACACKLPRIMSIRSIYELRAAWIFSHCTIIGWKIHRRLFQDNRGKINGMVWIQTILLFFHWLWNRKKFVREVSFDKICDYINHHRQVCIKI